MRVSRRYLAAIVLLTVFAVAFGVFGTIAPPLAEDGSSVQPQQESPSESVGHFQNPPTYDSGWMDITDKCGRYFSITHNLNTREVFLDIKGKQNSSVMGGEHQRHLGGTSVISGYSRLIGGWSADWATSMVQTHDGGYAICGATLTYGTPDGEYDHWLIKTDALGNVLWNTTYGTGVAYSVIQTNDGGYALAGSGGPDPAGGSDFWLGKTDSRGNWMWDQSYGNFPPGMEDVAYSFVQTNDGGYALAGLSGTLPQEPFEDTNMWLVKTDASGNEVWNRAYGGEFNDQAFSLIQTEDGGYAMAGKTNSFKYAFEYDFYLVRADSAGNFMWNRTYGGLGDDAANSLIQTADGGLALAGELMPESGGVDFYLVKTDSSGVVQWDKTYGNGMEDAHSVVQTNDGGYALAGSTWSYGANPPNFLLVRTDSAGEMLFRRDYGVTGEDYAYSLVQTIDGGYAMAGYSHVGEIDVCLIKTDIEAGLAWTDSTNNTITLYRGSIDPYWKYVRVSIWAIKEPNWIYGDINMDGKVDYKDLYIVGRNYGKTFSLLSLGGIVAVAGTHTVKKRKQVN